MILMLSLFLSTLVSSVNAESASSAIATIKSISIFKNEIQLEVEKNNKVKVGTKITAITAVNHKCLLVVKKVIQGLAYADATQCPGYATLKKGQKIIATPDDEVNEEIKATPVSPLDNREG